VALMHVGIAILLKRRRIMSNDVKNYEDR
jgi:hypothetical protein